MLYSNALYIAEKIKAELAPFCKRIEIAGSIRRKKEEVGDIEIVAIRRNKDLYQLCGVINRWQKIKGEPTGKYTQRVYRYGDGENDTIIVDIFFATEKNWGYIFLIRTGSADFSHHMASRWSSMGFKGEEGMLTKGGVPVILKTEEELFSLLRMAYVYPEDRI